MQNDSLTTNNLSPDKKYEFRQKIYFLSNDSVENDFNNFSKNTTFFNNSEAVFTELVRICHDEFSETFLNTIFNEIIEEGFYSESQKLFLKIKNKFGNEVSTRFLAEIYLENATQTKIVKSILYILADLQPKNLMNSEIGILSFSLTHSDYEIRDLALQCFEKWNDKKYLQLLKSIKTNVIYLDDYLKYIIEKIENK